MKTFGGGFVIAVAVALAGCNGAASPRQPSPSRIDYVRHHADALGVDKTYLVYIPAGYDDAPSKRWPVFYYLHGLTSPETEWITLGKLDAAADGLHLDALVVMPDADDSFYIDSPTSIDYDACMDHGAGLIDPHADPDATCVRTRAYETYITHDLVVAVDARYRTIATRDGRGIAGLSMGGYGSLSLGLRHPDAYAAIASHSGAVTLLYDGPHPFVAGQVKVATSLGDNTGLPPGLMQWTSYVFGTDVATWRDHDPAVLVTALAAHDARTPAIYLDCGTEDFLIDDTRFIDELLTTRGIDHATFYGPGVHDYAFWTKRIPVSLAFLRDHTTRAR